MVGSGLTDMCDFILIETFFFVCYFGFILWVVLILSDVVVWIMNVT